MYFFNLAAKYLSVYRPITTPISNPNYRILFTTIFLQYEFSGYESSIACLLVLDNHLPAICSFQPFTFDDHLPLSIIYRSSSLPTIYFCRPFIFADYLSLSTT